MNTVMLEVECERLKQHKKFQYLRRNKFICQGLTFFLHSIVMICFLFAYIFFVKMSWLTACMFGFMGAVFFVVLAWWNIYVYDVEGD